MPITLPTGVHLRGSTFHLRIGVPDDIRHLWPRRKGGSLTVNAYRASLRTSDRNEAAAKAHEIIAKYQRQFEELRASSKPAPLTPITDDLVAYIVGKAERDVLALDDMLRANPTLMKGIAGRGVAFLSSGPVTRHPWHDIGDYLSLEQHGDTTAIHAAILRGLKSDVAVGRLDSAKGVAETACAALAIRVDWDDNRARAALLKVMRALIKAWQSVSERDKGEIVETPAQPSVPAVLTTTAPTEDVKMQGKTLRDVEPLWRQRTNAKPNAIERTERGLTLFEEAVGLIPLAALSKAHGAAFVRFLSDAGARGFRATTAKKHASTINALINVAVKEDLLDRNPFDLSIDTSEDAEDRTPWSAEELAAIVSSALFTSKIQSFPRWRAVDPTDAKAALVLQLHTGARIGEVAQLRAEDFAVRDEVWTVRFARDAGTLKSKAAARIVPLADRLMQDEWFAGWLDGLKDRSGLALPSLHGRSTSPGDVMGRWFLRFRESVGLPDGGLNGSHKFRHWLRTELVARHVAEPVIDQIIGHSAKGSAGRVSYTGKLPLRTLKEAIDRVDFPAIANPTQS